MNVLLLNSYRNHDQQKIFQQFLSFYFHEHLNYRLVDALEFNLNDVNEFVPSAIIAFNHLALDIANEIKSGVHDIPIIYLFSDSEFHFEYYSDWTKWDFLFVIKTQSDTIGVYPDPFTYFISIPLTLEEGIVSKEKRKSSKPVIYYEFEGILDHTYILLRINRVLNQLSSVKNLINGERIGVGGIHNSNVNFCKDKGKIKVADIVVGSGSVVERAILLKKPVIVLGERGFAGKIEKTNISIQAEHSFQGRIGGELREHIPEKILMEEIYDILEMTPNALSKMTQQNYQLFKNNRQEIRLRFNSRLQQLCERHMETRKNLMPAKLVLSDLFVIEKRNEQFVLRKEGTGQSYCILELEEFQVVQTFRKPVQVYDVLKQFNFNETSNYITIFIKELIKEKILMAIKY